MSTTCLLEIIPLNKTMAETQFCPPNKHEYNTPTDPKHDRLHDRSCMLALADNGSGGEVTAAQPATEPLASTPQKASSVFRRRNQCSAQMCKVPRTINKTSIIRLARARPHPAARLPNCFFPSPDIGLVLTFFSSNPNLITQSIVFVYQGWHDLRFPRNLHLRRSSSGPSRRKRELLPPNPIRSPTPRHPPKRARLLPRSLTKCIILMAPATVLHVLLHCPQLLTALRSELHPTARKSARTTAHLSVILLTALRSVPLDNPLDPQCAAIRMLQNSPMKICCSPVIFQPILPGPKLALLSLQPPFPRTRQRNLLFLLLFPPQDSRPPKSPYTHPKSLVLVKRQ